MKYFSKVGQIEDYLRIFSWPCFFFLFSVSYLEFSFFFPILSLDCIAYILCDCVFAPFLHSYVFLNKNLIFESCSRRDSFSLNWCFWPWHFFYKYWCDPSGRAGECRTEEAQLYKTENFRPHLLGQSSFNTSLTHNMSQPCRLLGSAKYCWWMGIHCCPSYIPTFNLWSHAWPLRLDETVIFSV